MTFNGGDWGGKNCEFCEGWMANGSYHVCPEIPVTSEKSMVLITLKEYHRLTVRDVELGQLEAIGVDNWSEYGQYDDITGEDSVQEVEDALAECVKRVVVER